MDERDRKVIRHLHKTFGTEPFTTQAAAESASKDKEKPSELPATEREWAKTLEDFVHRELVLAEVEGWRLSAAILEAANIINI